MKRTSLCLSNLLISKPYSRSFLSYYNNINYNICFYNNNRFYCNSLSPKKNDEQKYNLNELKARINDNRFNSLKNLYLQNGANNINDNIPCSLIETKICELIDAQDSLTKDVIKKIVSTADISEDGKISLYEFITWFEPLPDESLNIKSLFEYWSVNSELKNPKFIFTSVWNTLLHTYKEENLRFPSQLLCLGGAPGSGKGTNTPFILRERGIQAKPIVMSSILQSPAMQKIKAKGGLVGDADVLKTLLEELLKEKYKSGAVIDGFPRTAIQVEFLRMLADQMILLQHKYKNTNLAKEFGRPAFRMIVLYVNEAESVKRQMARGKRAIEHNEKVKHTGVGSLVEVRETDISNAAARNRYRIFSEQALDALQSLREEFPYHVIDASGSIKDVEEEIKRELAYQSSLELSAETYEAIRAIPESKRLIINARQHLVERLDSYQRDNTQLFEQTIQLIIKSFLPIFRMNALAGACRVVIPISTKDTIDYSEMIPMIIDVLADRDYRVMAVEQKPTKIIFDVRFKTIGLSRKKE